MHNFDTEYKKLNPAQRLAVDTIQGPVLVVAGPGTGKTQLLSMRVANILKLTDATPSSILCLTFTNKAAANMRERLVSLIGTEAHGVDVKTFHSFAADVMSENPDYFWSGAPLVSAPDAVTLGIIQDILSRLPLSSPLALRYSGMYTAINDVQQGLKLAKEAGLTPEKLRSLVKANLAYIDLIEPEFIEILKAPLRRDKLDDLQQQVSSLPRQNIDKLITPLLPLDTVINESLAFAISEDTISGKTSNTSAWKRRFLQNVNSQKGMYDERRRNEWWLSLADVYEAYRSELNKRGYYDYADMIVEVISQLEMSAELLANVQEKFLYVLIDEFQDTNAAQFRLAHLVADNNAVGDEPNLMAVGDDDQSIFKFNGAELNNMLSFRASYPSARLIVLTENYRSSQAVLDTAKNIIEQAHDRLVKRESTLNKTLKAKISPKSNGRIEHQVYPTAEHQYYMLAEEIARAYNTNPGQTIAVLARSHSSLRTFAAALIANKLPLKYEQQQNIFENEAVAQVMHITQTVQAILDGNLDEINKGVSLFLRHPMWEIKSRTLWELAVKNFSEPNWLGSLLDHDDKNLVSIGRWLTWLAQESSYQPLPLMLEYLIGLLPGEYTSSPLKKYYIDDQSVTNSYLLTLSALQRLRSLASEFAKNHFVGLGDFVEFIRLNQDNRKVITDESWFVSDDNAIELLSVHKAKGLEFDVVYVIDAVEKAWQPRKSGRKPPANLPLQPYGDDYDDYVRLMYVAITRARHSVIASSYATEPGGEPALPTPLINSLPVSTIASIPLDASIGALEQATRWPRLETANEQHLLKTRLDQYQLNVTHLLNFLDVTTGGPRHYFERNLLRLPEAKSPSQSYGTAMHYAMETAQKLVNNDGFSIDRVLQAYSENLRNQHLPAADFQRYTDHGYQILKKLFGEHSYKLPAGGLAEQRFKNITVGQAILGGAIDRIDTDKSIINIVDYKTGKPISDLNTRDKSKQVKAWKHRTQLVFYALLVKNSPRYSKINTIDSQMVYLEAESANKLIMQHSPSIDEMNELSSIIQEVWSHIHKLSFPPTDNYPAGMIGIQQFINDLLSKKV